MIRISFLTRPIGVLQNILKGAFAGVLKKRNIFAVTFLGMLNGLLPCGLTFLALTYCATLPAVTDGFVFMAAFGSGTLPVMLGFTGIASSLFRRLNFGAKGVTAVVMIALGCLLISRTLLVHHETHSTAGRGEAITICRDN